MPAVDEEVTATRTCEEVLVITSNAAAPQVPFVEGMPAIGTTRLADPVPPDIGV